MYRARLAALRHAAEKRRKYSPREMEEIEATIRAIEKINRKVKKLRRKDRVAAPTVDGAQMVWDIDCTVRIRRQVYLNRRKVYLMTNSGVITPVTPRALGSTDDFNGLSAIELQRIADSI